MIRRGPRCLPGWCRASWRLLIGRDPRWKYTTHPSPSPYGTPAPSPPRAARGTPSPPPAFAIAAPPGRRG